LSSIYVEFVNEFVIYMIINHLINVYKNNNYVYLCARSDNIMLLY